MGEENHSADKGQANDNDGDGGPVSEEAQEYSGHKFGIDLGDVKAEPLPLKRPSMMGLSTSKQDAIKAVNEPILELGRPLRVLQVAFTMDMRGAETALVHLLRQVDTKRFQMDFITVKGEEGFYDEEIKGLGSKLFPCTAPSKKIRFLWDLFWVLKKEGPFDIIHAHPYTLSGLIILVAMIAGVRVRLVSAQTDKRHLFDDHGLGRKTYTKFMQILIKGFAKAGNAVSEASAESLFGPRWFTDGRWRLITSGMWLFVMARSCSAPVNALDHNNVLMAGICHFIYSRGCSPCGEVKGVLRHAATSDHNPSNCFITLYCIVVAIAINSCIVSFLCCFDAESRISISA